MLSLHHLLAYWSSDQVSANLLIFANLAGALVLGLFVGYERSYHGRAAGMRTYGIVCMASAALTVFIGYPQYWYGGGLANLPASDPTRVVQGIVTGIGFLGAGVIMKEGLNISGLTTAASIWASSAIGVLVGVGLYGAAILLTALSATLMVWGSRIEMALPSRHAIALMMRWAADGAPTRAAVAEWLGRMGYEIATGSVGVRHDTASVTWQFVAVARNRQCALHLTELAAMSREVPGLLAFEVAHARN